MGINPYLDEMGKVREEVLTLTRDKGLRPGLGEGLAGFGRRTVFAVKLILEEKELITFALLQWACIAFGYYLWVNIIGWIPEEAWHRASQREGATLGDVIMLAWSFCCVGLTAFPLGLLTGCMGAVHFLRRQGRESTIYECFKLVMPRAWPIWIFHWIDGWWTVSQILERLPKKNDRRSPAARALSEALYYAWKVATIGILPALVTGRGLVDSGKRSVGMVRARLKDVLLLRAGYSALCWIIGIAAYLGCIWFFMANPQLVDLSAPVESEIYRFYFWAGVPILAATGVIMLFLRPIYIISACDIYADYVAEKDENLMLPPPPPGARVNSALIAAIVLAMVLFAVMAFRDQLGITKLLELK